LGGPLSLSISCYTKIPASLSKKKKEAMANAYSITKPDLDNYIKFYLDVLNGIAYDDDRQIVKLYGEKKYSQHPRVEITVKEISS